MDIHPLIDTIHITVSHWRRWIPIALSTRDCVKELDYPDPDTHWRPSLLNIYKTFVDFTQAATPSQPWPIPACVKLNKLDVLRMFCGNPKCSPYQHVHLQFNNKNYTVKSHQVATPSTPTPRNTPIGHPAFAFHAVPSGLGGLQRFSLCGLAGGLGAGEGWRRWEDATSVPRMARWECGEAMTRIWTNWLRLRGLQYLTGFYHVSSANISKNHQQMEWIEIGSFGEEHSEVERQISRKVAPEGLPWVLLYEVKGRAASPVTWFFRRLLVILVTPPSTPPTHPKSRFKTL